MVTLHDNKTLVNRCMPVIFCGHGDPMLALRDNELTRSLRQLGDQVIKEFGRPKAILMVSAHWFTRGTLIQSAREPRQVYDMYGFPEELYQVTYPVEGYADLTNRVLELLGDDVKVDDDWGIDHGTWTVLVHMFPDADIPVVQLSVDGLSDPEVHYQLGKRLASLRKEGYLIMASGNVVHNLRQVEWDNPGGTDKTTAFNQFVKERIAERDDSALIDYTRIPNAPYAVPTPDHYLPLLYPLGASQGEKAVVFNDHCELGSMAMTGFAFGMDQ